MIKRFVPRGVLKLGIPRVTLRVTYTWYFQGFRKAWQNELFPRSLLKLGIPREEHPYKSRREHKTR